MDSQGPPDALASQPEVSGLTVARGGEASEGGAGDAHFGVEPMTPGQGELLLGTVQAWTVKVPRSP